jgi:hypothetical protein
VERIGRSIGGRFEFFPRGEFFPTVQTKTGLTGFPNRSNRFSPVGCREEFLSKEVSVELRLFLFKGEEVLEAGRVFGVFLDRTGLPPSGSLSRSFIYDALKPRLRPGRGKLGKYSDRPRQAQTTRGGGQGSWSEQSSLATRRLPRQGITTWLQCTLADSDVRRDVPATKYCNSFLLPLVPLPL